MSFYVFEMVYTGGSIPAKSAALIPLSEPFFEQYRQIYNACFYEMRRALGIEPYHVYSDSAQFSDRKDRIFLLTDGETVLGSVGCCGTEIDDLIVNPQYQGRGYGRLLLVQAINMIRSRTDAPVTLHVAEWNRTAVQLYTETGFTVKRKMKIG